MKHKVNGTCLLTRLSLLTLTFLLGSIVAFAQGDPGQSLAGKYEGMVKKPGAPEEKVSLELKSEGGKISARATHGEKSVDSTEVKLDNGTLTLNFGNNRVMTVKIDGDRLVGEAVDGTQKIPLEFKKITTATAAAPINLSGQWEGVADANGQPFPFLLTLKIEGEKVSGSSSSQLGESTIKSGTWKDGRLVFEVEGQNGTIAMSATVVDGKLSGEFDFAGQLQGKWVAVKKN